MAMARPMAGLPLTRNSGCGGSEKPPHGGDVAEAQRAVADGEVDVENVLFGGERAGDPERQRLVAGLDRPARAHDILRVKRAHQRRPVDAERGELLDRELDEDLLVLGAQDLDL
jgi:hypothetical protein